MKTKQYFAKFLSKLEPYKLRVLALESAQRLTMDERAELIDAIADGLNEQGYDWGVFREGDEQRRAV